LQVAASLALWRIFSQDAAFIAAMTAVERRIKDGHLSLAVGDVVMPICTLLTCAMRNHPPLQSDVAHMLGSRQLMLAVLQDDALSDVRFRERAMQALGSYHVHWLRLAVQTIVGAKVPATTGGLGCAPRCFSRLVFSNASSRAAYGIQHDASLKTVLLTAFEILQATRRRT
jgi:hypothetical protein